MIAGGQSSLADYCTYFVAYSDGSCTDTNSARAPDRMLGEVRGSNSRLDLCLKLMNDYEKKILALNSSCEPLSYVLAVCYLHLP